MLAKRIEEEYEYEYNHETYPEHVEEKTRPKPVLVKPKRSFQKAQMMLDKPLRSRCRTLFIVFTVLAMAVTIRSGISASRGYVLVDTQQRAQVLEQENERMRIEIAQLKSPQRIKAIATEELGLQVPTKVYFGHEK
ncbi:MAG: cell division protein FtsL [Selenomonadaceae bacterium]|nr:cell division protein FtsL [Selenomonadaceae bacterium]